MLVHYFYTIFILCVISFICILPTKALEYFQVKIEDDNNDTKAVTDEEREAFEMEKIIGGACASKGQFPFLVSVQYKRPGKDGFHICGGSIVNSCNVLTAAHCCDAKDAPNIEIVAGIYSVLATDEDESSEQETLKQIRKVEKFVIHPLYSRQTLLNDICIIHLDAPFNLGENITAIRLPTRNDMVNGWNKIPGVNPGWGRTVGNLAKPDIPSNCLKYANLTVIGSLGCGQIYAQNSLPNKVPRVITANMICAYDPNEQVGACIGDSGGPLLCKTANGITYLAGIVSSGELPCAQPQSPGIYTYVYAFLEFINQNLKRECK